MISRCFQNFPVKSQVSLCINVNKNDGGPAAGLLSLIEVPEKAIVNAFDYVTFIHRLT
jgi:hypothetical protein